VDPAWTRHSDGCARQRSEPFAPVRSESLCSIGAEFQETAREGWVPNTNCCPLPDRAGWFPRSIGARDARLEPHRGHQVVRPDLIGPNVRGSFRNEANRAVEAPTMPGSSPSTTSGSGRLIYYISPWWRTTLDALFGPGALAALRVAHAFSASWRRAPAQPPGQYGPPGVKPAECVPGGGPQNGGSLMDFGIAKAMTPQVREASPERWWGRPNTSPEQAPRVAGDGITAQNISRWAPGPRLSLC